MSGIVLGLSMVKSRGLKSCLSTLEMEAFEQSTPKKHPAITWKKGKGHVCVYRKTGNELKPVFNLNDVGLSILRSCDGKSTPRQISKQIFKRYQTTENDVHQDTLFFLAELKARRVVI
jgi:hypothetical protein